MKAMLAALFSSAKTYLIAAGALILMLIGAGLVWGVMHAENAKLTEDLKDTKAQLEAVQMARDADAAASKTATVKRAAVSATTKERNDALAMAQAANPDWSSQRVPAAVVDSLRNHDASTRP